MSMWAQIQKLPDDMLKHVQQIYSSGAFPYEVRNVLAEWIENQPWSKIEYDNPEHEKFASSFVAGLIDELHRFALNIENHSLKLKLEQVAHTFSMNYINEPFNLVRIVNNCLTNEAKILRNAQNVSNFGSFLSNFKRSDL